MITPKHLSREFGLDARWVRLLLRRMFDRPPGTYWKLTTEQAREARRLLRAMLREKEK